LETISKQITELINKTLDNRNLLDGNVNYFRAE